MTPGAVRHSASGVFAMLGASELNCYRMTPADYTTHFGVESAGVSIYTLVRISLDPGENR